MNNAPYQPLVTYQNLLFVSGQLPINDGEIINDIQLATAQCIKNIEKLLKEQGSDLSKVLKTTVFMINFENFDEMNTVYQEYFYKNPPARSAIQVSRLPKDACIEIECIAYK